jgi:hypothetical protein
MFIASVAVCVDDDELLGVNMHTIKKNTEALLFLSKEVGLEVSFEKLKYTHVFKFYSHQLMHFLIQPCISLLSYVKVALHMFRSSMRSSLGSSLFISLSMLLMLKTIKIFKKYYQSIVVMWQHTAR